MKKEFKRILKNSKELLDKDHLKKLKEIKDIREKTEGLKYLIHSNLLERLTDLESKVAKIEKKEALIAEAKLKRLHGKIAIFKSTYSKEDLMVLKNLIKEIEEEVNGFVR